MGLPRTWQTAKTDDLYLTPGLKQALSRGAAEGKQSKLGFYQEGQEEQEG